MYVNMHFFILTNYHYLLWKFRIKSEYRFEIASRYSHTYLFHLQYSGKKLSDVFKKYFGMFLWLRDYFSFKLSYKILQCTFTVLVRYRYDNICQLRYFTKFLKKNLGRVISLKVPYRTVMKKKRRTKLQKKTMVFYVQ